MNIIEIFKQELETEAATTIKMLSIVPDDKYDWKPHEKSMTIKQLTTHLAEIPGWIEFMINTDELDFHAGTYKATEITNTKQLVEVFQENVSKSQKALSEMDESLLTKIWTMRGGEQIYSAEQKHQAIRHSLSQLIHHRAQLGVDLRLLNIPIPASYGVSADDMGSFA